MTQLFDVGSSSIDPGITLIEASAGTGKTFAIAGMVVRLVAERGLSLAEILIVTFTEAATQELRDRVRSRIREAIIFLEEGRPGEDPALAQLAGAGEEQLVSAIRNLKNALLSFDEAAIFTIHGFCQRMLRENAFETGALFDVELVTDAEPIWRETAEDFWRKQFYTASPDIGSLAVGLQAELSAEVLVGLLRKLSRHPELKILSGDESLSLDQCKEKLAVIISDLRGEWRISSEEIANLLKTTNALSVNRKDGYHPEVVDAILDELRALDTDAPLSPSALTAIRKLSARQLEDKTVRKRPAPKHSFFHLCADFENLLEAFVRLVRSQFIGQVHAGLAETKKRRNVITFDDLLTRLYEALRGPGGTQLAASIGRRFHAALIDEFQDTDPVQWEIFYRLFGIGKHLLFLIGDPKQAIYGFRGADIFTYMEARSKASARFTLGTNWRSDKALVEGANALFSRHEEVFVFPEISFYPVLPADKADGSELDLATSGLSPQPLQVVCVESGEGEKLSVGAAKGQILQMMRGEINRLLTSGVTRSGRELEPGDIAVLVRTNREAESVRELLVKANIPAVLRTDRSVLQTEEAEHLLRLLTAVLEPHKNGVVKAALASPLFGCDAEEIYAIDQDEKQWQELTEKFHAWQETWNRHGFMRMFRGFLAAEPINEKLLALTDGERMVTNYQHVAECLHAAEYEKTLTPSTLLRWLREQHERAEGGGDSYVIRLEKDENAVQIVTIHRSKGLEYPVVFCPFNWTSVVGRNNGKDILFHDREDGNRLTWDLREKPGEENRQAFKREQLAEAIRLLYVAVTRARNRCYLFWAVTRDSAKADNCALAHAFGCGEAGGPATPSVAFQSLATDGKACLHEPWDYSADTRYQLTKAEATELNARVFRHRLPQGPLITSFSGLVARVHDEAPDRDGLGESMPPVVARAEAALDPGPSVFSFPKGAKAGNFFHTVLETLDFSRPDDLAELVEKQLHTFCFDASFQSVIAAKLRELLNLPLPGGLKLGGVSQRDRLVEAPFYFPIRPVSPPELAEVFGSQNLPKNFTRGLGRLGFDPVDGYMTGFIDLVLRSGGRYFLIDWKSNWLGPTAADYRGEALERAMAESHYYLQYHLYTLAMHRHLVRTVPDYDYERDFGGVFYIFLRGVEGSDPSSGIFHDRPSLDLVEKLQDLLLPAGELVGADES